MSDRLGVLGHPWCPRCGVIDGPLNDGNCGVCLDEDDVSETVEYVVWASDHLEVVDALQAVALFERDGKPSPEAIIARGTH